MTTAAGLRLHTQHGLCAGVAGVDGVRGVLGLTVLLDGAETGGVTSGCVTAVSLDTTTTRDGLTDDALTGGRTDRAEGSDAVDCVAGAQAWMRSCLARAMLRR